MIAIPVVAGASATGAGHARAGLPCQDAYGVAVSDGGTLLIAVADGLGSARLAHLGAARAVEQALAVTPLGDIAATARAMASAARDGVTALAAEHDVPLRDVATTLIAVACRPDGVATAHVGDGAVVVATDDGYVVLSEPGRAEYVNEVTPLTDATWEDALRLASLDRTIRAVAVLTDGCEHAALGPDGSAHAGFFDPILAHVERAPATADADLAALLGGAKLAEHSDDDKTLVVAILPRADAGGERDA